MNSLELAAIQAPYIYGVSLGQGVYAYGNTGVLYRQCELSPGSLATLVAYPLPKEGDFCVSIFPAPILFNIELDNSAISSSTNPIGRNDATGEPGK